MPGDYLIFVASAIVSLMDRCRTLCLPGIGSYAAVGCVDLNDALFSVSNSVCIIHLDPFGCRLDAVSCPSVDAEDRPECLIMHHQQS